MYTCPLHTPNLFSLPPIITEMITLADGCSVVPNLFETKLKELLPPTSNCMLVGMRRPFLIMLITLKVLSVEYFQIYMK